MVRIVENHEKEFRVTSGFIRIRVLGGQTSVGGILTSRCRTGLCGTTICNYSRFFPLSCYLYYLFFMGV